MVILGSMPTRRALLAVLFSMSLPLAVGLVGGPRAAYGTEVEGPCGDQPCDEVAPDAGPCGDQPCDDIQQPDSGPCGDQPCDEIAPDAGPCGDQPCDEPEPPADPSTMSEPLSGTPDPGAGPETGDDGAAPGAQAPAKPQSSSEQGDVQDLEAAADDKGSFPIAPAAAGIAAVPLIGLAWLIARRRRFKSVPEPADR